MAKYKIGDEVWWARYAPSDRYITCPDCCGKKYLTVILGDDSQVTIDCTGCQLGYDPPRGYITTHDYAAEVTRFRITGVEEQTKNDGSLEVSYRGYNCYAIGEDAVASTKEEADTIAALLIIKAAEAEKQRLLQKEKPTRDWGWNATYHRQCIKRMEADLVYHKAKLDVAVLRKKAEKSA